MRRDGPSAGRPRRLVIAGLAAGTLAGAALGASLLSTAAPAAEGPQPLVLHAAPALVTAATPVDLSAATYCEAPEAPSCQVAEAAVLVRANGVAGWAELHGSWEDGVLRFRVPAELVPEDGFAYWIHLITEDGGTVTYPPGGAQAPINVITSAGLPEQDLASFSWTDRSVPTATLVRLPVGQDAGQIGFSGAGTEGGVEGPSSFDVTPSGGVVLADWVNGRAQRFGRDGRYRGELPLPAHRPVDLAVADGGGLLLTTLGVDAQAFEVDAGGHVLGRYPIGYGVASRVVAGVVPRVRIGSGQWVPVRVARGVPLTTDAQGRGQTATVPLPDGRIGVSEDVAGELAVVWTRPDGSRGGSLLRLPRGVQVGADYFVRPLDDGGALVARGLWDETHFGIAVLRFAATGRLASFSLLPEPTHRMVAPFSTVRFAGRRAVLEARDDGEGLRIDRFRVR